MVGKIRIRIRIWTLELTRYEGRRLHYVEEI